jgi:hypothetical protein
MTRDPAARERSLANLRKGRRAQRGNRQAVTSGATAKQPVGDVAAARQISLEWLVTALAPILDKDGNLPKEFEPAIEVLALPLARLKHMAEWLETHPGAPGNFRLVREMRRTERHVWVMLESFGGTPKSKAALGLTTAQTKSLEQVLPKRDPEHLQKVARFMAQGGMLPSPQPPDADVVEGHEVSEPEPEPKVRRIK